MNKTLPVIFGLIIFAVISISLTENLVLKDAFGFVPLVESGDLYVCDNPQRLIQEPSDSRRIHLMNQTDFTIISSQNVTISGLPSGFDANGDYAGCNGLTVDPTDGTFYMLLSRNVDHPTVKFNYDRWLATIDPTTGIGSAVGNWGNGVGVTYPFGSIAFNSTGHLHGIVNSDIGFPEKTSYHYIDKTDATPTLLCNLGLGEHDFWSLGANHNDGKIYLLNGGDAVYNVNAIDPNDQVDCLETPFGGWDGNYNGFFNGAEQQGSSFNTNDGLMWSLDNYLRDTQTIQKYDPANNSTGFDDEYNIPDGLFRGIAFALSLLVFDSTAPVISAIDSEPITLLEDSSFDAFEFVDCVDDTDGAIVPNGNFWYVGGITIDTSVRGLQSQDYDCTDSADNTGVATIDYIVKKKSTGGSGGSSSSTLSGTQSTNDIPKLSDIPVLSFSDSPSQTTTNEGQSISDLFANLFDNRITEGITTPVQSQGSNPLGGSGDTTQRPNPITDFLQNLFANFFN